MASGLLGTSPSDGQAPKDLSCSIDSAACAAPDAELFGMHVPMTGHDDCRSRRSPSASVPVRGEFTFRQLKDPHVASCSPMFH